MITKKDVKKAILEGESLLVEFKEKILHLDSLAGEITALANTEGGIIIIGIDDQGNIKGLKQAQGLEENIMNLVRSNIEPALSVDFLIIEMQDKKIAGIKVPKSASRPHKTNQGKYYIRVGTTKRFPSQEELARMYQNRGLIYFDIKAILEADLKDIDKDRVNNYFHKVYQKDLYADAENIDELLVNLDILKEEQNRLYPTIAGLLFFGTDPQKHLKSAGVKLVHFKGENLDSEILQKKDIIGNVPEQIEQAVNFIRANIKTKIELDGIKRREIPQFPIEAIREIIVNALAHRDYSILNQKIRIFLFSDRLEVISPGRLPNTVTLENITFKQASRNPTIVRFLDKLGYLEEAGMGIYRVIQIMKKHNLKPPKFEIIDEEFKVILFGLTI